MKKIKYPFTVKQDLVEDFHGTKVPDPYRWLEDLKSRETVKWIKQQNKITYDFLRKDSRYSEIRSTLSTLWNYSRFSAPFHRKGRYFYLKNDGLQNQFVLYYQDGLDKPANILLDPNQWSKDGTSALENFSVSEDGRMLAYGRGEAGSDWQKIWIMSVDSGKLLSEKLDWCRFSSIAWKKDSSGFFYNRFPETGTVSEEDRINFSKVYWHTIDTPQSDDILIHHDPQNKELSFYPFVSDDGKYLLLHVSHGTDPRNMVYLREVDSNLDFLILNEQRKASLHYIYNKDNLFYFRTDLDSPQGKVVLIDINKPEEKYWQVIIPESDAKLEHIAFINDHLVVIEQKDVISYLKLYDKHGQFVSEIELPGPGTVSSITGRSDDKEFFIVFTSFLYPTTVFRYDFLKEELDLFKKPVLDYSPTDFETRQIFYTSRDGTSIPMFITALKGIELDSSNPVILYGYGGFNVDMKPTFSISNIFWMKQGGIYAVANLRGGSEYGEEWHKAGMLDKKQNVFDDFIAAGEYLIDQKYTSPARMAIMGGSNGGLITGACMIQRPDLFGAVICRVPVLDMLRYHKFTVGRYWIPEFGDPENPDHFKFLYAYSPLHNIKTDAYPATLIMTADTDDRVFPAHAFKFTAALQEKDNGNNPILLRVEQKAGHGHGKPMQKIISETADIYAFLFKVLGME